MKQTMKILSWSLGVFVFALCAFFGLGLGASKAEDTPLPVVQFENVFVSHLEADRTDSIQINRSGDTTAEVNVNYTVAGDATADVDYVLPSGTVKILAGETSVNLVLEIKADNFIEPDEVVEITLSVDSTEATLGANGVFYYMIGNDDATLLITYPEIPDGQNSWFVSGPIVILANPVIDATTYYTWNDPDGMYLPYADPIIAPEGENTLYYFSEDTLGSQEVLKWQIFKVDTLIPETPQLAVTIDDNHSAQLSWQSIIGVSNLEVYRDGVLIATLSGEKTTYTDPGLVEGQSYTYAIFAIDRAGNVSLSSPVTVQVAVVVEVKKAVAGVTTEEPRNIIPAIGRGSNTKNLVVAQTAPQVVETPTQVVENPVTDTGESEPVTEKRNWNKLLLAISLLIIAAGVVIGGYYGYDWYLNRKEDLPKEDNPKNKSRW